MAWEWHDRQRDARGRFSNGAKNAKKRRKSMLCLRLETKICEKIRERAAWKCVEMNAYVAEALEWYWRSVTEEPPAEYWRYHR